MNLEKKLKQWQENGLISTAQCEAIRQAENKSNKNYLLHGIMLLSFFLIGLGIISIIASNWDIFPNILKLGGGLTLLGINGYGAYWAYDNKKFKLFDGLLFLFSLMILAQIGLIIQVYQIQPEKDAHNIVLLWSLTVLPLIFFARSKLLPALWWPNLWAALIYILSQYVFFETFVLNVGKNIFILWIAFWAFIYQISDLWDKTKNGSWRWGLKFWLAVEIVLTVIACDFYANYLTEIYHDIMYWHEKISYVKMTHPLYYFIMAFLLIGLYITSYLRKNRYLPAYLTTVIFIGTIIPLGALISLAALAGIICYTYRNRQIKWLNLALTLTGIRIFILYTEVIGSLAFQGAALITNGVILLGLIWGTQKLSSYFNRRLNHEI